MARSFSNAKAFAASVPVRLPFGLHQRGFAAAAPLSYGTVSSSLGRGEMRSEMAGKMEERSAMKEGSGTASCSWAPDPVRGYYRPGNCVGEIDAAELRELLLNHKVRPNQTNLTGLRFWAEPLLEAM